jgi:hypothetical protein
LGKIFYGGDTLITFRALLIKFLMTFVFGIIAFSLFGGNTWSWIFLVALVATIANYVIGDLAVLSRYGNIVASIGDGITGALIAYIFSLLVREFSVGFFSLFVFFILIAAGEYFFHGYLLREKEVAP